MKLDMCFYDKEMVRAVQKLFVTATVSRTKKSVVFDNLSTPSLAMFMQIVLDDMVEKGLIKINENNEFDFAGGKDEIQ